MMRTILAALTLAATTASVGAAPALAQDMVAIKVGYSDLNLNSTAGAAVLERRIDAAVTQICGRADNRDPQQRALVSQCRQEVSVGADAQGRQAIAKARQTVLAAAPQPTAFAVR
jgi:UrcA family protein